MPETLSEAIGSAYDASQGQTATETPTEGNQGSGQSGASLIDIEAGSPESQGNQQATASAQQVAWELAQGVAPETVIGTMDGKPVTAGEVRDSFFRTQDYTKKTQELSQERTQLQSYVDWYQEAEPYLRGLNSDDPAVRLETVTKLAQSYGVELGGGRQRDERGRFASQQQTQDAGLIDLSQFDEDSEAWALANTINQERQERSAMQSKLDSIEQKFEQFTGSVASAYETNQRRAEADAIASKYQQSGLDGLDVDGALQLVGKPMDVATAMRVHHYEAVLRHNYALAKGGTPQTVPNEPASGAGQQRGSLRGVGLSAAFDERIR